MQITCDYSNYCPRHLAAGLLAIAILLPAVRLPAQTVPTGQPSLTSTSTVSTVLPVVTVVGQLDRDRQQIVPNLGATQHTQQAAQHAVQNWKFHPALKEGLPVSSQTDVPVHFKLE